MIIGRVLPIVLILVTLGLFFGYVSPVYNQKIVPLQAEIKQYNSTLAAAADFNTKEAQLAGDRNAIPGDGIMRLQTYLPDGVDNVQLILDLNALAARSGIQLSNFDIKEAGVSAGPKVASDPTSSGSMVLPTGDKKVDSLDLTVKAIGTYPAFRAFLGGVEQSLRPMDLVQMTVTDAPNGVYSYDMTFRIYWLH